MFKSYLKLVDSNFGKSVITTVDIPSNVPILEFGGNLLSFDDIKLNFNYEYCLQIGNDLFLGPSGGIDDYVNHSCNPNSYVHIIGNRAVLYSKYLIKKNSHINFDYSLSSTDDYSRWKMDCKCGSFNCRKIISGYQYLDDKLKKELERSNYVPLFQIIKFLR